MHARAHVFLEVSVEDFYRYPDNYGYENQNYKFGEEGYVNRPFLGCFCLPLFDLQTEKASHDGNGLVTGLCCELFCQGLMRARAQFVEEYGGYLCGDVTEKVLGGRNMIPSSLEELETIMKLDPEELNEMYEKCSRVTENAAGWTVAAILEMDEK